MLLVSTLAPSNQQENIHFWQVGKLINGKFSDNKFLHCDHIVLFYIFNLFQFDTFSSFRRPEEG